jgi:hypothetical protein
MGEASERVGQRRNAFKSLAGNWKERDGTNKRIRGYY